MSRSIIVGWPETFSMSAPNDECIIASKFYLNTPCAGFFLLHKFPLRYLVDPFDSFVWTNLQALPEPFDPFVWMKGNMQVPITLIRLSSDVRIRIAYTGLVPDGMKAGEAMRVIAMFIGVDE
jgi:hypothetical protein